MWIFGYGSLIWKPNLPYDRRVEGYVQGWVRRFYQGSPDHRGTPEAPGRVVTLLPCEGERTHGVAFHVPDGEREHVLEKLDVREQGGYIRRHLQMIPSRFASQSLPVLVYMATPENPEYLGKASEEAIARHILHSHGPSGSNAEYLLELERSLRAMHVHDPHTFAIADHLRAIMLAS